MECCACRSLLRNDAWFCIECGTPASRRCEACGGEMEPEDRYCGHCGSPARPSRPVRPAAPAGSVGSPSQEAGPGSGGAARPASAARPRGFLPL
jgi:hypothetical protein